MGEINNLQDTLQKMFGDRVKVIPHNVFYDETLEINALVERVMWEGINLPAVFVGDELRLQGHVDETAVIRALKDLGLDEI